MYFCKNENSTSMPKKKKKTETQEVGKYINPFTDFGFKKIFGEEANKDLLIDFLNELLRSQNQSIKKLRYKNGALLSEHSLDRKVVYDLYCENEKGEKFIVELQKAKQEFFKDRMVYYSSYSIREQGKRNIWDFNLKAVYIIGILDFWIDDKDTSKIVVSHNKIIDIERNTIFYDKLTFVTLQMPAFEKSVDELKTNFDKWLYVIKNLNKLDHLPEKLKNKIFEKLFAVAEYSNLSKDDQKAYEESLAYYRDLKNSLDTAHKEGYILAQDQLKPILNEERRQKEEAVAKAIEEQRLKEDERRQKEEERRQKEAMQEKFKTMILKRYEKGMTKEEIALDLEMDIADVERILKEAKLI